MATDSKSFAPSLLWSRGHVQDIARAARLALELPDAAGQIFNVCQTRTGSFRQWSERIADAAGWGGEFVTVAEDAVPPDMHLTRSFDRHVLFDGSKAPKSPVGRHLPSQSGVRRASGS
jgi:nucleoside-diphosphate-sugar epimerase